MKIKVMPPMIFYGFILLAIILNLFLPIKKIIVQPYNYIGIIPSVKNINLFYSKPLDLFSIA